MWLPPIAFAGGLCYNFHKEKPVRNRDIKTSGGAERKKRENETGF